MSSCLASLVSGAPPLQWRVEGAPVAVWLDGSHIHVVSGASVARVARQGGGVSRLASLPGTAVTAHLATACLTVLVRPADPAIDFLLVTVDLATWTTRTLTSVPRARVGARPWVLEVPRAALAPELAARLREVRGEAVYVVGSEGRALVTDGVAVCSVAAPKRRWQFVRRFVRLPGRRGGRPASSFGELAAAVRRVETRGAFHLPAATVTEVVVGPGPDPAHLYLLTECGDLWEAEEGRRLLGGVARGAGWGAEVAAVTWDGAIYSFPPTSHQSAGLSARQLLPGAGVGEVVREVVAAATMVSGLAGQVEDRRVELEQLRLATTMLDSKARVFEQEVNVTSDWAEGRGVLLHLTNTSSHQVRGELWRVLVEVRGCGGAVWTRTTSPPPLLPPLGRLSLHLHLPNLLPRHTPVSLTSRLVYCGERTAGLVPTQMLATSTLSLLDLARLVSTGDMLPCSAPPPAPRPGLLASLGVQAAPPATRVVVRARTEVARSGVEVLAAEEGLVGCRSVILDCLGVRVEATLEAVGEEHVRWVLRGEAAVVEQLVAEMVRRVPGN